MTRIEAMDKTADQLLERTEDLKALRQDFVLQAKDVESAVGKRMLERKKTALDVTRKAYAGINILDNPAVVVAALARIQGEERVIKEDLAILTHPDRGIQRVDEELALCKEIYDLKCAQQSVERR